MSLNTHDKPLTPLGHEQLTSFDGAGGVSLGIPAGCTHIFMAATTAGARYRDDGTAPTAAIGMPILPADGIVRYPGDPEVAGVNLRVIGIGATAILDVSYYKA
jgi:hypothetical protein